MSYSYPRSTHRRMLSRRLLRLATATAATCALGLGVSTGAIASPIPSAELAQVPAAPANSQAPEIDTSVSREYAPAIVYIADPQTQELEPRSVLVTADEPVEGAVGQIVESYEGQDIGIQGYDVEVDAAHHEAEINFAIQHPRGARAFQSLSSANQYALIEAIRETLLTQPSYEIDQVIFMANGQLLDI